MARLEELRQEWQERIGFLLVYIKEAHPEDEWQMAVNHEHRVVFNQPKTFDERLELARTFADKMGVSAPVVVDDIENTANACYAAWPERLYVVEPDGRIAYKGGMGPFYFDVDGLADFLAAHYG